MDRYVQIEAVFINYTDEVYAGIAGSSLSSPLLLFPNVQPPHRSFRSLRLLLPVLHPTQHRHHWKRITRTLIPQQNIHCLFCAPAANCADLRCLLFSTRITGAGELLASLLEPDPSWRDKNYRIFGKCKESKIFIHFFFFLFFFFVINSSDNEK